ncbi:hypothetical protein C8Q80DRAFT_1113692 [Daedaleopsis nitida]|nr:hypothetical protein C8Q80DRAFT_1113692 [Daedaleopsis nitida]
MPSIDHDDDVFGSRYLAPSSGTPRKSPSSLSLNGRKSSASLRGPSSLADALGDDANGRHSLAHELAAALLPEPSASSKLLAEEFGIEYDEGAEGIDGVPSGTYDESAPQFQEEDASMGGADSLAAQLNGAGAHPHPRSPLHPVHPIQDTPPDFDPDFRSPVSSPTKQPRRQPEQDPMAILAADLEYTEKFLSQLRHLDAGEPAHSTPTLERLASDMIRHINDAARDRETQLRELLECEREFRKIAGEVGGTDALGALPELEDMIKDDVHATPGPSSARADVAEMEAIPEDATLHSSNDWEVDLDRARLGDEEEEQDEYESAYSPTPVKTEFPPPPAPSGPATAATAIPHLAHLRTFTTATATSLATISEHTQVNAAATTEAGRKIRALKNKLGGWRTEWDSAERSRVRIERWEAGIVDGDATPTGPTSPSRAQRRVDGRKLVQEHLQAFEKALMEANTKTQAIIAAVS